MFDGINLLPDVAVLGPKLGQESFRGARRGALRQAVPNRKAARHLLTFRLERYSFPGYLRRTVGKKSFSRKVWMATCVASAL